MSPIMSNDSSSFMVNNMNQNKIGKQFQKLNPTASGPGSDFKPNMGYPRVNNQQPPPPRYPKQNQRFKGKKKYNPNVFCTYCGKIGHIIDEFYRLIGFPEDFNFTNEKNHSAPVRGNAAASIRKEDPNYYMDQVNQHMSKEQFGHFIQVMKQMKIPESTTKSAAADINANAVAGTILKYFGTCFSVFNSGTWIIDSGPQSICVSILTPLFPYLLLEFQSI